MKTTTKNDTNKLHIPYYDPNLTYKTNLKDGPFGAFADNTICTNQGEPQYDFLGHKVYLPFGIPAGPLPNAKFTTAAFKKGFDICVYKTVRTQSHPTHPWPNIVPVKTQDNLTIQEATKGIIQADDYTTPIAITNSFGVGSYGPDTWQPDMKKAVNNAGKGQILVGSFQGTNRGQGKDAFIHDHVLGARLVKETGAKIIELNLSCPNEGHSNLLCFDTPTVLEISNKIKNEIGNTPLILKMPYYPDENHLKDFVVKLGKIVDGLAVINTIQSAIRKKDGEQALPGKGRLYSGVCGAPIKWAGLDMVKRLNNLKEQFNLNFKITGVGGVTTPLDYFEYKKAGADDIMSATGSIWNPYLAQEIKAYSETLKIHTKKYI